MARLYPYNEAALLERLSAGDADAFEQLFLANWDGIFSAALLITKSCELADDITQDVFLLLWKDRDRAGGIQNLRGYLHNTVKFLVHKKLRRIRVEDAYRTYLANKVVVEPAYPEPEAAVTLKQLQTSLSQGIAALPPQQRAAFLLSREQGLTHEEISLQMGISRKTVKDYIVRAIAFLRLFLQSHTRILFFL